MNVTDVDSKNVISQLGCPVDTEKPAKHKNMLLQINSGTRDMRVTLQKRKKCPTTKQITRLTTLE
jgi:hypothetical protein